MKRLSVVAAIVRRDYDITRSYRTAFVLDVIFGLLNLVVFYFISKTFGDLGTERLGGAPDYFSFAAVGLAVTLVMQSATTGVARRIREEQLVGSLEVLVAQPVTSSQVALGLAGFPFTFALVRACLYLAASAAFLGLSFEHADLAGLTMLLVAIGIPVTAFGIGVAALVVVFKRGESLAVLVTFGLGFVSGAVFPVTVLPGWLEWASVVVPTRYAFEGLRAALFQGHGFAGDLVVLLASGAVLLPLALAGFAAALRRARRAGSLAQY